MIKIEQARWFKLIPQYSQSRLAINGAEKTDSGARYKFWSPDPLNRQYFEEFDWKVSVDRPSTDLIGYNLSWLIFSDKAKRATEDIPNLIGDFLKLPDAILKKAKNRCRAWLFHPRHVAPVLDLVHSKLSWSTGGKGKYISAVHEMWLKPEVESLGSAIIRLEEDDSYIVVAEAFRRAWQDAKCTGLRFEPVRIATNLAE